ncbi:Adenine-specific methyltransferase [hydrothermal vent metagenome]|uniref:site-specific DNA-methyltransferase (adenine-specific) n=1 Tax=hydrothermal vent metagenome TaxID=652676 RepID=A0A1W1C5X6_9ZZZZ
MYKEKEADVKYLKSPLNYTGGKFKLLKQILPLFPEKIETFYDLFAGGCNVALNVKADRIVCNDILTQLINLYEAFKENTVSDVYAHIENRIKEYQLTKENKDGYLELRKYYNENKEPLDLFVLICYAFNNSIRFNSKGGFNIPFGKNRSSYNKSIRNRLEHFLQSIVNIEFENKSFMDFESTQFKEDDFVYIDPPYLITVANYNENDGWCEDREKNYIIFLMCLIKKELDLPYQMFLNTKGKAMIF